jgi:hypothetical protein
MRSRVLWYRAAMTVLVPCRCRLPEVWRVWRLPIPSLTAGAPHVWPYARRRAAGRVPSLATRHCRSRAAIIAHNWLRVFGHAEASRMGQGVEP